MDPISFSSIVSGGSGRVNDPSFDRTSGLVSGKPDSAGPGESFSEVLAQSATGFVDTIKKAEATSVAGIKGEAGVYEVAMTVMEAEQQLRVATTIRDRVVQAFQEISRMQI